MIPRHYQQGAHDAGWQFLFDDVGNPLLVLPTGAGKSLVIAMLVRTARACGARVIVLQHRKELIKQNAEKIQILLPELSVGICSAGLKSKIYENDVVCAGIQSVHKHSHKFGRRELILIDEVHLVGSGESMYGNFLSEIMHLNETARAIGLTATPYRTGEGPICGKGRLFQKIAFEAFTGDLIKETFLCPITNKVAETTVDTSKIRVAAGEFIATSNQEFFNTEDNVDAACQEIVSKASNRHSILSFCTGVEHAETVAERLRELTGERVEVVTGETFSMLRDQYLQDFANGSLRWLVNCDVLTTGFDAPCIDCIAILRATMSPGLFAQIVGRGLRTHPSKSDCLILDFGENIARHGSLDDRNYGRAAVVQRAGKTKAEPSEVNGRGKECPNCGIDVAVNVRACPGCNFFFPVSHSAQADHDSKLTGAPPVPDPEEWTVEGVGWSLWNKKGDPEAPPTLRVDYKCRPVEGVTPETVSEWVCLQHQGFARTKAETWWQNRVISDAPDTIEEAIAILDRNAARHPVRITTVKDGRFTKIQATIFGGEVPLESDWEPERAAAITLADITPDDPPGSTSWLDDDPPF